MSKPEWQNQKSLPFSEEQIRSKANQLRAAQTEVALSETDRQAAIQALVAERSGTPKFFWYKLWGQNALGLTATRRSLPTLVATGTTVLLGLGLWISYRQGWERQTANRWSHAITQIKTANVSSRILGISALETIVADSADKHWASIEVLTAFIRQRAPRVEAPTIGKQQSNRVLPDIEAALTLIQQRNPHRDPIDRALNLQSTALRQANLKGATLNGSDFRKSDLSRANLSFANLHQADLRRAVLFKASLEGANLEAASLTAANLYGSILRGATLQGANLYGAILQGADLRGAMLNKVNLSKADLSRAILSETRMSKANFRGANLSRANLYGANLQGAVFSGATLNQADLRSANLHEADLRGAALHQVDLRGATLNFAILEDSALQTAVLCETIMPNGRLSNRDCQFP